MAPVLRFDGDLKSVLGANSGATDAYWITDRAPINLSSVSVGSSGGADGKALSFNLNETGVTSGHERYQGSQLINAATNTANFNLGSGSEVSARFYIDPNWKTNGQAEVSGLWVVMNEGASSSYSIVEYVDASAIASLNILGQNVPPEFTGGFRFWNSTDGWNKYQNSSASGWVDLKFTFGSTQSWTVSQAGNELATYSDNRPAATSVATIIVNNQNFGQDKSFLYDNIVLVRGGTRLTDDAVDSNGNLLTGTGNSSAGFVTARDRGIELGLSVRETNIDKSDPANPIINNQIDPPVQGALKDGIYHFARSDVDPFTRVAYSVATFDANTTIADKLANYDILMTYDRDTSVAEQQTIFIMRAKANGSGYEWVYDANSNGKIDSGETLAIVDDRGTPSVTQNIQNPSWYDGSPQNGFMGKGSYDVRLIAIDKATNSVVTQNHIVIDIAGGAPSNPGGGGGGGTTPTPNPNTPTPNPNAPTPFVPSTAVDPSPNDGFNEAKAAASVATFFTGTAPSVAKQAELNAFANLQFEAYKKAGVLNPALGPYEALGRGFSETIEFSQKYAALTEAEFITARYIEVFGRDPSVAQQAHFQAQIDYFELIYENAGISSAQADLFAKGAVLGQMIGHAALAPVTATAQATTSFGWDLAA